MSEWIDTVWKLEKCFQAKPPEPQDGHDWRSDTFAKTTSEYIYA